MKTNQKNATPVQNGEAKAQETQSNSNLTANSPENNGQENAPEALTEQSKEPEQQPSNVVLFKKPVLGLDATLRVLDQLHRESLKRANLLDRIAMLEDFEVQLMEEADELEGNHYQGCKLVIIDNKNRQFVTNTSGLIKMVADFVKTACYEKLAEIEANIVFPQAA